MPSDLTLAGPHLRDPERGQRELAAIAAHLGDMAFATLLPPLMRLLPRSPDADMALNNLERFFANPAAVQLLPALLDHRARPLEILLQLFATSQTFSDLLVQCPEHFDMLRVPLRKSPGPAELREQLRREVEAAGEGPALLRVFRRFRQRQLLRIGTNDIIRDRPLEEITRDISRVADAALDVAWETALRHVARRHGEPVTADGRPVSSCVLAFGKLGAEELNYSSDLDLMFLYSEEGETRGPRITPMPADEFFARVVSELLRLLAAHTERGLVYRIDLRLRPEGQRGPLARSLASTLSYYDAMGRTWERQALIKVRPVAGDLALGARFVQAIEPFVYRKYLSFSEINEIKAVKRRIEQKAGAPSAGGREVKTGRGGIRDIEFTIQFLQLLNGHGVPALRGRDTLGALAALERAGCLTDQEYRVLDDAYRFLRKTEHRLQLLFDLQTHRLPEGDDELHKLALRLGYGPHRPRAAPSRAARKRGRPQAARPDDDSARAALPAAAPAEPREALLRDYHDKTEPTRRILDHLLHQTFGDTTGPAAPEADLVLDPSPSPETIRTVLGRYPFRDIEAAYANLMQLGQEVPFLSTRRCRHFLASIAPALLRAVAEAPDPDMALLNLEKVTRSLGAKTVLWELFSFNPPSLKLYVDLCANSQFLSEVLITNPGMIDELLDSLVLNQPRSREELAAELEQLCRGATDPAPILHSFQDKELLRIGVRDVLGKSAIADTTAALSDLAETILTRVTALALAELRERHGGGTCPFVVVALGKLGAGEMNYHSDLDLMLIYEDDAPGPIPPFEFFTELAQRLIRQLSEVGPMGRLYQVDMRLRPSGKSGNLVLPLAEWRRYYAHGPGQLWERQALTRARVVLGEGAFLADVSAALHEAAYGAGWQPERVAEMVAMRQRLEASRPANDLKRGPGGLADVEFLLQRLQLEHGQASPSVRQTNTWTALTALREAGLMDEDDRATLAEGYGFLLRVQNRLRIVHNRTIDAVPEEAAEVVKLARRLGMETGERLLGELQEHRRRIRSVYHRVMSVS